MSVFGAYAHYYDLLYRDKDYAAEARYVAGLLRRHGNGIEAVLELGCGSGIHAAELAAVGLTVCGVDASEGMVARARERQLRLAPATAARLSFAHGDARSVRTGQQFDAVISLFHVFSYQVSDTDLRDAFATAAAHLRPGGLLLFDCWFGPAVLTMQPAVRVRRLEDEDVRITRIAEPVLDANANTVEVRYDVIVTRRADDSVERFSEAHMMRFLFTPEVRRLCADVGLTVVGAYEWMTTAAPNTGSWAACFVARA